MIETRGGSEMKVKKISAILVLIFILLTIVSCEKKEQKGYKVKKDEEFFGTWINEDYKGKIKPLKIIIKPDGTYGEYAAIVHETPSMGGRIRITDKWTDSEGSTFYKTVIMRKGKDPVYFISKIDKTLNVYEEVYSTVDMPVFDPSDYNYRIYYRQE